MERCERPHVWVIAEQNEGELAVVSRELTSKGRQLANALHGDLVAVLLGYEVGACAPALLACGADRVYLLDSPLLRSYQGDAYVPPIEGLVRTHRPGILLLGATLQGLDLAPRLAARLGTGLAAHCIDLSVDEAGRLTQIVPTPGQATVATIICPNHWPQMATVAPGTFQTVVQPGRTGEVVRLDVALKAEDLRLRIEEEGATACADACDLAEAKVVVAGGAGIGSEEGWHLLETLAARLGGAMGASRPAVDAGWASAGQMIGHSGRSVRPKVYIGVGISGDMLHMIGARDAQVSVAINKDPRAPVFAQVDIGIVGDYREVVPALLDALVN